MPHYYTSDVTQLPYAALLQGGGSVWPIRVRIRFALRKAIGWHFPANSARTYPIQGLTLEERKLPPSLRDEFPRRSREVEECGFLRVAYNKSNTLGYQVSYTCTLIGDDRSTVATIVAIRTRLGSLSNSAWAVGFRSDLSDGTILLTVAGPQIQPCFFRPHQRWEVMPEQTPITALLRRHRERVSAVPASQIARVPTEGVAEFLLVQAQADFSDLLASGMFRRLSSREIANLKGVVFDFE
jgi:hypothetical protein